MSSTDTLTAAIPSPDLDQGWPPTASDEDLDPVIVAARAAGRLAGERLARAPLSPHQRAVVASVMGGGVR